MSRAVSTSVVSTSREPLPVGEALFLEQLPAHLTATDLAYVVQAAAERGQALPDFVRDALLREAAA